MNKKFLKMRISNGKDLNFYIDFMDRYKIKKLEIKNGKCRNLEMR